MKISSSAFVALASSIALMRGAGAVLVDDGNNVADVSPNHASLSHLFEKRAVNCAKVTGVLAIIKILGPPATSFCRSYIKSPGVTTLPPATVTATITLSVQNSATVTVTITTGSPVVVPARLARRTAGVPNVRDVEARAVPAALLNFAAAEISSACRCLNLAPTSTVTPPATTQAITITATGPPATFTDFVTTCSVVGGPCTRYDNCCGQVCVLTWNGVPAYTCTQF